MSLDSVEQTEATPAPEKVSYAAQRVTEFATAILHGDDEHREWLTEAAEAFNASLPLPPPRGKGVQPQSKRD